MSSLQGLARELLTAEEVAGWLKLSPQAVRRWARLGKLPALKLGHHEVRFEPQKIERWLRDQAYRGG